MLRRSEWLLVAYFLYIAILGMWRFGTFPGPGAPALILPLVIVAVAAIARADSVSRPRAWGTWGIVRDWLPAGLVLVAYWSVDWIAAPHGDYAFEHSLVRWDRWVLDVWRLRAAVETFGALIPGILELAYLVVYAILPLVIADFYLRHRHDRLDEFLLPFLAGTLSVYALLPHFSAVSPRLLFEGVDIPPIQTVFRGINVWILDRWDIESSALPSGHVAAVFSAATALWLAVPERRAVARTLMLIAVLAWVCTLYSRYHYAADGLLAIVVSAAAIAASRLSRALSGEP